MVKIVRKKELNPTVTLLEVEAPLIAKKAKPGQFIIFRVDEYGERVPLTIADHDPVRGTVTIIFQKVGLSTQLLGDLNEGDTILDFVGPLGEPTQLPAGARSICVIGGGVGLAIAYPVARALVAAGNKVTVIMGARTKDLLILTEQFRELPLENLIITTDDGSEGEKGVVTAPLERLCEDHAIDQVFAVGPVPMMKFSALTCEKYDMPITASLNPIMVDGTGMCGGCRLTVGGETKFACVDGPEFDGHLIDFDEAMCRSTMYADFEKKERDEACNLFKMEVK